MLKTLTIFLSVVLPFIGSGGHGHVFVGADLPHGAVHAGPMNTTQGWDWCSGYHYSDSTLAGFAQTRLGGTGVADYGDIVVLPQICETANYSEYLDKSSQVASPGYYSVLQMPSGIKTQITSTRHCAIYKFTFPENSKTYVKFDLTRGAQSLMFRKAFNEGQISLLNKREIKGKRVSSEWTFSQPIWFLAHFSEDIISVQTDSSTYAVLYFGEKVKDLELRIAISGQSEDNLRANLKESSNKSFTRLLSKAKKAWDKELGAIEFKSYDSAIDTIFYTSLYHSATSPQLFSDANQKDSYTIFSLWDTYRAVHPLYNLIDKRSLTYCQDLLDIYYKSGRLPVWILGDRETDCMVGVHSISVLCETALKGLEGLDPEEVLDVCSKMLEQPTYGMSLWDEYGYLPADKVNWSVSVELEYCISAKCVALLARKLGRDELACEFEARALRYVKHFDPNTGFMRGLKSDGSFTEPFDPSYSMHEEADYVEGNAWQYSFLVPHDVEGLARLYGGYSGLEAKLDALFTADSALNEGASADITGMIGQYAHGNEPSHHIIYLYSLIGKQDKAADLLRKVCSEFYSTKPDGLIGNEDCGQMSAWYIFSALGFYPVFPSDERYVFGTPLCTQAKLHLTNGKTLEIKAHGNSSNTPYIKEVRFNGKKITAPFITHEQLMQGGLLEYEMSK